MTTFFISSNKRQEFLDITSKVSETVSKSGVKEGTITIFTPHTTAGLTINENADPDVLRDLDFTFNQTFPNRKEYFHMEGNSDSHMKSTLCGASLTCIISEGRLVLGTWQSVYFCEFDGPRTRKVHVQIIG